MKYSLLLALAAIATFSTARATTVIAPDFNQLVGDAEVIFQGTVTDVQSQWAGEGAQRHIISYVTFAIEDALKGAPGSSYTMRMLGGTVGDQTMEVSDSPKFTRGDRDILFVEHNGTQFVPLVGIMFGRFHVQRDQARNADVVLTNEGAAVADVNRLGKDENGQKTTNTDAQVHSDAAASLSSEDFKSAIRGKLTELAQ